VNPDAGDKTVLHISAQVENSSSRDGAEVVQLYVGRGTPTAGKPIRQLAGLQRIQVAAGESRTVEFDLNLKEVSAAELGSSGRGRLIISVGGGQPLEGTPHVEVRF